MNDEEKRNTWWSTLPGIMTGLAAAITALAGLVAAITQTGWFTVQPPPGTTTPATSSTSTTSSTSMALAPAGPARSPAPAPSPPSQAGLAYSVTLPALREYRLGEATFTLLKAEVTAQTTEKDALKIRLRMMNHGRFDANFWDNTFRLVVDNVPMAPESGLNELVPGQSAKEGEVLFIVPHGTAGATLKIIYADDSTEIPLVLAAPR